MADSDPIPAAAAPPAPGGARTDLPDARMFWAWVGRSVRAYIGWILVAAGGLAIVLGWFGVSGQALVAKQLPYLVSGGIFGLGLVALGTFYLFSEDLRRDSGRIDRLERMVAELHGALLSRSDAPDAVAIANAVAQLERDFARDRPAPPSNGTSAHPTAPARLVALPESQRFHRAGCRMVEGKAGATEVTLAAIRRRHLQPCGMCDPVVPIEV